MNDQTPVERIAAAVNVPYDQPFKEQASQLAAAITDTCEESGMRPEAAALASTAATVSMLAYTLSRVPKGTEREIAKATVLASISEGIDQSIISFDLFNTLASLFNSVGEAAQDPDLERLDAERQVLTAAVEGTECPGCGEIHDITDAEREMFRDMLYKQSN